MGLSQQETGIAACRRSYHLRGMMIRVGGLRVGAIAGVCTWSLALPLFRTKVAHVFTNHAVGGLRERSPHHLDEALSAHVMTKPGR